MCLQNTSSVVASQFVLVDLDVATESQCDFSEVFIVKAILSLHRRVCVQQYVRSYVTEAELYFNGIF